jgi:hypothetical protein
MPQVTETKCPGLVFSEDGTWDERVVRKDGWPGSGAVLAGSGIPVVMELLC